MFKRKIYQKLLDWKNSENGRSAFLLEGARRVGKSTVVSEFGKNEYKSYILIDFSIASKAVTELFDDISDLDYIFLRLQYIYKVDLYERQSVIIFDEVECCPKARQALKHLVKDHRYDYIETGSLISIKKNVKNIIIPSEEYAVKMHPMDFEEFTMAVYDNNTNIRLIKESFDSKKALGVDIHRRLMRDFRLYMLIGGMPQAVDEYIKTNNFMKVDLVKRKILKLYNDDFMKLDSTGRLSLIFSSIPSQLSTKTSRYHIGSVLKGYRVKDVMNLIAELNDSQVVDISYDVTDPNVGLETYKLISKFKIYLCDTGLFITKMFDNKDFTENVIYEKLLSDKLSENLGYIYENVVANILVSNGYELYYHTFNDNEDNKNYEIDFLLTKKDKIVPIEVKSGSSLKHKSLDKFIDKYGGRVGSKYIVCTRDLKKDKDITYIPTYMSICL